MPLLVTPSRLARLSEFYHQLGAMQTAGVSLIQALEQLRNAPPSHAFVRPAQRLLDGLNQGLTFAEALKALGRWLPSFDLALLAAGEQSGRLDVTCRVLAEYYANRAALARQILSDLAYPVLLLHAAVFLFPFAQFFLTGDWVTYARQTIVPLLPLYGGVLLLVFACQGRHGETWRSVLERFTRPVPVLGKALRSLALARLSVALEALLNAGVLMVNAWSLAAAASGSPALRRAVAQWVPRLQAGDSPADLLPHTPQFPEFFSNLYRTGKISGTLDDTLKRLRVYYEDESRRKLKALCQWVPRLIYLVIVVLIAIKIVGFWVNYYNGILNTEF
jgi:type II secretory pathway component PulF